MVGFGIRVGFVPGITLRLFLNMYILSYRGCDKGINFFAFITALLSDCMHTKYSTSTSGQPGCLHGLVLNLYGIERINIMPGVIQWEVRLVSKIKFPLPRFFRPILTLTFKGGEANWCLSPDSLYFGCVCVPSPL